MSRRLRDWRRLPPASLTPLWSAEADRWRSTLDWDLTPVVGLLAGAREDGRVPGLVLEGANGAIEGWTCFLPQGGALQIAMIDARDAEATGLLLDGALSSPAAKDCDLTAISVPVGPPGLPEALAARGFDVATYQYLVWSDAARPGPSDADAACRPWSSRDLAAATRLYARAYDDSAIVRPFAPHNSRDEWASYVAGLVAGPGVGTFRPDWSVVADGGAGRLDGALLATDLGCGTAHVAQVAVDPAARRRGLGAALVRRMRLTATDAGAARVTLLVAEANTAARALYATLGFRTRSAFLVGVRRQPRRLSSLAVATGGVSTRR